MRNYWSLAFTFSLLFHTFIFTKASGIFERKNVLAKKEKTREIKMFPEKIEKIIKEKLSLHDPITPLPYRENIMNKLIKNSNFTSQEKPQIFEKSVKEIIFSDLPQISGQLKKNQVYMNYYRLIRERIRLNAYKNYTSNKKGEIFINFLIAKDGTLKDLELGSESVSSGVLKTIALKSIKEAAPFPAFPAELSQYSQLQFSISIYFKNN